MTTTLARPDDLICPAQEIFDEPATSAALARAVNEAEGDMTALRRAAVSILSERMKSGRTAIAEAFAERVRAEAQPSRREAMEFAADTLDVLLTAEDRIVDSLDDDQLGALDEGTHDPFSWVDPGLLDVFTGLER